MNHLLLLLALVAICTSWVSYVQSAEQSLESDTDSLLIQRRELQDPNPCAGNFTYDFSNPQQSYLPPVSAKCKTIAGSLYLTSCIKANKCVLPKELSNVEVISDTLMMFNLIAVPKNKFRALGTLNIAYGAMKSLKPLSGVKTITNAIYIVISAITSLEGLENIEETGVFSIAYCPISKSVPMKLKKVAAFSLALVSLPTLEGFGQLESTEQFILSLSSVTSVSGLKSLKKATNVMIAQNGALSLINFPALTEASLIAIGDNQSLRAVSFPSLKNPQIVSIDSCFNLEVIDNLGTYENATSMLSIGNLPSLKSIKGLSGAKSVKGLVLYNITSLESLDGLENLHDAEAVYVMDLPNLKSLKGLRSIHHAEALVFANLHMIEYPDLDSLTMTGILSFSNVPMLKSFKGLSNLMEAEQFGIQGPAMIKDFAEVPNLAKLKGYYVLANGLSNLESIAIGTGNLGRPNVYLTDHDQTLLKWKPTQAFLVKVCPKKSKITWNGCPGKGLPSVVDQTASTPFVSYTDLGVPTAEEIKEELLSKVPNLSR